ncbi:MAG: sensor signal transduction histidine kinase [Chitinophagaceae bacterium]|nr:sensor signal transduction histidine kinase [Chitinophagaceae bacterium]
MNFSQTLQAYVKRYQHAFLEFKNTYTTRRGKSLTAQALLQASEERFRALADDAPVLIWISGTDRLYHFFNKGWLDFTGRTMEQEIGSGWTKGVHSNDLDRCLEVYHSSFEARKEFYMEYRLRRHDGEFRWIWDKGVPSYSDNGEFTGYTGACMDIHDRIVFEEKLRDSEARLRIAAISSELGTWDFNPVTQEMSWDSACKDLFGSAQDTPVTLDLFWSKMHLEDKAAALDSMLRAMNPDIAENYESEYRIIGLPDNKLRWIRAKGRAFFDQKGVPVNFAGTVLDITEEKIALEALQKNERKFRLLADALPQLIWTGDAEGHINYCSQAFIDYSGLQLEQLQENGWLQIIHPEEKESNTNDWIKAIANGEPFISEHRLRRHDGEYRWQLSRVMAQRDERGTIIMWVGTSTDIHKQKMASTELEHKVEERTLELAEKHEQFNKQKEFAEIILNSSVDIISLFDTDLRYLIVNKKFEEMYGIKESEIINREITDVYPKMKESEFYKLLLEASKGKASHTSGYQSIITMKYYETFMVPLMSHGKVSAVLVIAHDNTELIRAYHQLEVKNKELEKSNHNLEQFAYIASHDLQEPLRKIRTFTELLYNNLPDLSEQSKSYFNKIDLSAKRMTGLIRDVLNYSRLSIAEQSIDTVDLNIVVAEIKNDFELLIQEKKAIINALALPVISGIPLQLNQLFSNLIGNALKFCDQYPIIELYSEEVKEQDVVQIEQLNPTLRYIRITCKDNGIGFDPKYAEQIFNIFQRLNNRDKYEGTGIGLALCKKIMENHKGLIMASSGISGGAVFHLYFPAGIR